MKNKLTLGFAAVIFSLVVASCGSKPAETTASEQDSAAVETPAPVVESDSTATTTPADSSAAQ